jgi:hypothetical protein
MDLENILFEKEGLKFSNVKKNHYKLQFTIENNNIDLSKIIDFNLIKLIYDLNPDVYENVNFKILNQDEAVAILLMNNFFEELGLPQKFSHLHIGRIVEERKIIFQSQTIKQFERPIGIPHDAELMALQKMVAVCDIIHLHKANFSFNVNFEDNVIIPSFAEKMVGIILHKIFKRVKQFIENVRI